jgi:hypothetical protein
VTVEGVLALPERHVRAFIVATCLGRIMKSDGDFSAIKAPGDALCVEIRTDQRGRILKVLDRSPRAWQDAVAAWVRVQMAHRCPDLPRGGVCLFLRPTASCPRCDLLARQGAVSPRIDTRSHRASDAVSPRQNVPDSGAAYGVEEGAVRFSGVALDLRTEEPASQNRGRGEFDEEIAHAS